MERISLYERHRQLIAVLYTVMVPVTPWWAEALQVTKMVSLILLLASAAWAVVYHVRLARRKKQ